MRNSCIVCGSTNLSQDLDLGVMPSSNNLPLKKELKKVKSFPLKYYSCSNCSLFQLLEIVSGNELFRNYLYLTSVNKELVAHFKEMANDVSTTLNGKDLAIVIGSNDGAEVLILKESLRFKKVIGIEPAINIAEMANKRGAETINNFFNQKLSKKLVKKYGNADLVTANNVFAHIPDPEDMLLGMKNLIKDDGSIVIEVHWLKSMVEHLEIETLYAEHYYVWTVKSMRTLADKCKLKMNSVLYMPKQHGGSLRFTLKKSGRHDTKLEREEEKLGLYDLTTMKGLQIRADNRRKSLRSMMMDLKANGKRISIWSVPAKIPTLINFCGFTSKEIEYAYEVSPSKIGRYIPKANIFIKDEKLIEKDMPDYLIIGAWNYIEFAEEKLKWYTDKGGKLINPLTCRVL